MKFAPTWVMRAHRFKATAIVEVDMRPINVSLNADTWELAKRKKNFSQWIRLKLHEERRVARELMQLQEDLTQARSAIQQYVKIVDELSRELDSR
jgi:TFIIF-interacting CTD phosphatase-like protein